MNVQKESQLGAHAIMWAVMNKPQEVRDLLSRNGIATTGNILDKIVFKALKNSKQFRADFVAMMAKYPEWATSYMSMNGEYSNYTGIVADKSLNLTTAIGTDAPKKSWFTADNIQGTLNTALNAFLTLDKNATDRALAGSASDVAMYNSQTETGGVKPPKEKDNTVLYVILGVLGVALVGGLIYVGTKKR